MFNIFSDAKKWRDHCKELEDKRRKVHLSSGAKIGMTIEFKDRDTLEASVSYTNTELGVADLTGVYMCEYHRDKVKGEIFTKGISVDGVTYSPHIIKTVTFGAIEEFTGEDS